MKLVAASRLIWDTAERENKRELTAVERESLRAMDVQIDNMSADILLAEKQEAREDEIGQRVNRRVEIEPEDSAVEPESDGWLDVKTVRDAQTHLARRTFAVRPNGISGTPDFRKAFSRFLKTGKYGRITPEIQNALQAESDTGGGYTIAPQQFVANLLQAVDDQVFIRGLSTVTPVANAESIGRPSLDADPADADWTSELATGTEDSTMIFGKRELHPHPLAKRIKVSNKLIRQSALSIDSIVTERLSYKFAISQEKAFLLGSGSNQPLGLFTATADGISTARDVSTGNSTTAIGADGLIEALYKLKAQYQMTCAWIFHRDAIKQIRKLKDGNGQYLWQPGINGGQQDRILDKPFYMSEYAPNTFTTGLYVGILGNFTFYWIADALQLMFQRLMELYAETNQTGFIGRLETDAMPVLEEAFVRVKLA